MGIIQIHPPAPVRTPDCNSIAAQNACNNPNPPDWCDACNNLPIDGWIPFMIVVGLVIGLFSMRKYGKTS